MRISDWSSDVCSSDLIGGVPTDVADFREVQNTPKWTASANLAYSTPIGDGDLSFGTTLSYRSKTYQFEIPNPYIDQKGFALRSEEHTSELQSLMRISYAVFRLKNNK